MSISEVGETAPEIGTRVHVMSVDLTRDLGFGTYLGEVRLHDVPDDYPPVGFHHDPRPLSDEESALIEAVVEELEKSDLTTPKIKLDTGETVYGCQCWWSEAEGGSGEFTEQCWSCEKCMQTGSVKLEPHADVMSVVHLVGDDHHRVSPKCDEPPTMLRVLNTNTVH